MNLFNNFKDCKSYWRLVKQSTKGISSQLILGIRSAGGKIETEDKKKADILYINAYFSTIGEKFAMDFPVHIGNKNEFIKRVTPTKMNVDFDFCSISKIMEKFKANKACGPDSVAFKLTKKAGDTIIPSLMSIYLNSIAYNAVPEKWKFANVAALYKKEDEADKQNHRPISLLCVTSKIMES